MSLHDGERSSRLAFWVSFAVALLLYGCSLGNGVSFGSVNQRVVAASTWGIAAPPGYPCWTMLANLFTMLFGWVSWEGVPNPAWAVSCFSALCGASCVGVLARLMTTVLLDMVRGRKGEEAFWMAPLVTFLSCCAAILFALSPQMWFCSVRADVEAWEMLLFCGILSWSYHFLKHPTAKVLGVLSFLFGLALTNGLSFLWLGVPLWGMVFVAHRDLAKALLALFIPIGLTAHLLSIGALPSAYEGHLFAMEGMAVVVRPMPEAMHGVLPLGFLPMGYYVGLFGLFAVGIVSVLLCPRYHQAPRFMRQMVRHWWVGVLVAAIAFLGLLLVAVERTTYLLSPLFEGPFYSFTHVWLVHLVALGVLWGMCVRFHRSRRYALVVSFVQIGLLLFYQHGFMLGMTHPRLWWFWWPLGWVGVIFYLGYRWLLCGRGAVRCGGMLGLGLCGYLYVPLVSLWSGSPEQWGEPFSWLGFHRLIQEGLGLGLPTKVTFLELGEMIWALCFSEGLGILFWGVVGLIVMGRYGAGRYRVRWLCFLLIWLVCCCLVFLLLPAPSLIHAHHFQLRLEVILICGLSGLVATLALALLRRFEGPALSIAIGGVVCGMCVFVVGSFLYVTIYRAALQVEGGPEMRGHTMAWTWGRMLLEGAPGVDLKSLQEEPLPDPFWPPPLSHDAILLSSTQVPYYFTSVGGVREDVKVFEDRFWSRELYMAVCRRREGCASLGLPDKEMIAAQSYRLSFKAAAPIVEGIATPEAQLDALVLDAFIRGSSVPLYFDAEVPYGALYRQLEPAGVALQVVRSQPQTARYGMRDVDFWDWFSRTLQARDGACREGEGRKRFAQRQLMLAELYRQQGFVPFAYASLISAMSVYPIDATVPYVEIILLRSLASEGTKMPLAKMENALQMLHLAAAKKPENRDLKQLIATVEEQKNALQQCKRLQLSLNKGTISINERCLYIDACLRLGVLNEAREVAQAFASMFIPPARSMEVLQTVLAVDAPEVLYAVAMKLSPEQYHDLTERALLEIVKVALDYHARALAHALLAEGEARLRPSALLYWRKACYYHLYDDVALAEQYLEKAKALSPMLIETLPEDEQAFYRAIEARAFRLKEKGTRL